MFLGEDRRCRAAKNSRNFTNPTQIIGLEPSDIYHDTKFLLFVNFIFEEYICSLWIYFDLLPSESYVLTIVLVLMEIGVWLWSRKP